MNRPSRFTESLRQFARENYLTLTHAQMSDLFKQQGVAISQKTVAYYLQQEGLLVPKDIRLQRYNKVIAERNQPRFAADDAFIQANYPTISGNEIAKQLNRNAKYIYIRIKVLGLQLPKHPPKVKSIGQRHPALRSGPKPEPKRLPTRIPLDNYVSVRIDDKTLVQARPGSDINAIKSRYARILHAR